VVEVFDSIAVQLGGFGPGISRAKNKPDYKYIESYLSVAIVAHGRCGRQSTRSTSFGSPTLAYPGRLKPDPMINTVTQSPAQSRFHFITCRFGCSLTLLTRSLSTAEKSTGPGHFVYRNIPSLESLL